MFQDKDVALLASKKPAYLQEEERSRASFSLMLLRFFMLVCAPHLPTKKKEEKRRKKKKKTKAKKTTQTQVEKRASLYDLSIAILILHKFVSYIMKFQYKQP